MFKNCSLINQVIAFIKQAQLILPNQTIIIGLSGGPDSVFLVHVLSLLKDEYNLRLITAHLNHGWRTTAALDEKFCADLTKSYQLEYESTHADKIMLTRKSQSREEEGRLLRRAFFEQLAQKYNAHKIALAHHKNDQQETFFIRLIRGSSLTGLTGIKAHQGLYIRPLLSIKKAVLLSYLNKQKIAYITDETNEQETYLRNRIRRQVIPALETVDPRFPENFERALKNLQEADSYLVKEAERVFTELASYQDNKLWLDQEKLLRLDPVIFKYLLVHWLCNAQVRFTPTTAFFYEILRFLRTGQKNKHNLYNNWSLYKKQKKVTILKESY